MIMMTDDEHEFRTVQIRLELDSHLSNFATGFLISEHYILTVAHALTPDDYDPSDGIVTNLRETAMIRIQGHRRQLKAPKVYDTGHIGLWFEATRVWPDLNQTQTRNDILLLKITDAAYGRDGMTGGEFIKTTLTIADRLIEWEKPYAIKGYPAHAATKQEIEGEKKRFFDLEYDTINLRKNSDPLSRTKHKGNVTQGSFPKNPRGWGGISGAPLICQKTSRLFGIAVETSGNKLLNNELHFLPVQPFLEDKAFSALTQWSAPSAPAPISVASQEWLDPELYLDRYTESKDYSNVMQRLIALGEPQAAAIGFIADPSDEPSAFIRRCTNQAVLADFHRLTEGVSEEKFFDAYAHPTVLNITDETMPTRADYMAPYSDLAIDLFEQFIMRQPEVFPDVAIPFDSNQFFNTFADIRSQRHLKRSVQIEFQGFSYLDETAKAAVDFVQILNDTAVSEPQSSGQRLPIIVFFNIGHAQVGASGTGAAAPKVPRETRRMLNQLLTGLNRTTDLHALSRQLSFTDPKQIELVEYIQHTEHIDRIRQTDIDAALAAIEQYPEDMRFSFRAAREKVQMATSIGAGQ